MSDGNLNTARLLSVQLDLAVSAVDGSPSARNQIQSFGDVLSILQGAAISVSPLGPLQDTVRTSQAVITGFRTGDWGDVADIAGEKTVDLAFIALTEAAGRAVSGDKPPPGPKGGSRLPPPSVRQNALSETFMDPAFGRPPTSTTTFAETPSLPPSAGNRTFYGGSGVPVGEAAPAVPGGAGVGAAGPRSPRLPQRPRCLRGNQSRLASMPQSIQPAWGSPHRPITRPRSSRHIPNRKEMSSYTTPLSSRS